ncbi:MAG TPA: trypsin-like peptidase domain-containing protein, partial [Candidatus Paceibacterota bacterium]
MFIKGVLSFIFTHLLFLGGNSTTVYVAPPPALPKTEIATTTIKNAVSTEKVVQKAKTETPVKKAEIKPKEETPKPVTPPAPLPDFEKVNTFARKAIVNILCSTKGGELSPISGTGVVISSKGVVLTNAHIAQYFLLKDFKQKDYVGCVIRTGSPAYPEYKVELMYISPTWIGQNRKLLKEEAPKGTGENDFAFLRITGKIDGSKLPESFSYVIPNIRESIDLDEPVLLVSYPAGFLG